MRSVLVGLQARHFIDAYRTSVVLQVKRFGVEVCLASFFDLRLKDNPVFFGLKTPVLSPAATKSIPGPSSQLPGHPSYWIGQDDQLEAAAGYVDGTFVAPAID